MDKSVHTKMKEDEGYAGAGAGHMFGLHTAVISSQYMVNWGCGYEWESELALPGTAECHDLSRWWSWHIDIGKHGAHELNQPVGIKTSKYSGRSDCEAFNAQFELLAHAFAWSEEQKALPSLLTDDALSCFLLLDISERAKYGALVGALWCCFAQCFQYCSELHSGQRIPGEPLWT